jgi:F0F1-type ATP synthase delta subunit
MTNTIQLYDYILLHSVTKEEIDQIRELLSDIRSVIFSEDAQKVEALYSMNKKHKGVLDVLFSDNKIAKQNKSDQMLDFDAQLEQIDALLQQIEYFRITLAFKPQREFLLNLKDKLSKNTIFIVKEDPELLGGLLIEYKGIREDYSLNKYIDQYFMENQNVLLTSK